MICNLSRCYCSHAHRTRFILDWLDSYHQSIVLSGTTAHISQYLPGILNEMAFPDRKSKASWIFSYQDAENYLYLKFPEGLKELLPKVDLDPRYLTLIFRHGIN